MSGVSDEDRQRGVAIETPHDHDILSGRGNFVNYHAGNEHFRALVRKHKVAYVACPKSQKGKFSQLIVDEIKQLDPPGRFLKQDDATKLWYDIGEKKALDKTRQALREGAPEIQKVLCSDDQTEAASPEAPNVMSSNGTQQISQEQRSVVGASCERYDGAFGTSSSLPHSLQGVDSSNILSEENADPYCSTLPPQLYENFESKPIANETMNMLPVGMNSLHMPSTIQDQMLGMQMTPQMQFYILQNGGFLVPNSVANRFVHSNVALQPPLMTINEAQGQGFENSNNFCNLSPQQFNGQQTIADSYHSNNMNMSDPGRYNGIQPGNNTSSYNPSHTNVLNGAQSRILSENGLCRPNQGGNTMNRTYKVRPEPIMLRPTEKDHRTTSAASKELPPVPPEIVSSRPFQDIVTNPGDYRAPSPRRMVSNRNTSEFRSITPRRMGTDYFSIAYNGSPPRASRSRLRGRRDDSMRSIASTKSIGFDKIFGDPVDDSVASKNSMCMSGMSLSVGEVLHSDYLDPNNLGPLFESSVKVSGNSQSIASSNLTGGSSMIRIPPKRLGSSDLMYIERGAYEMSVNTIVDASCDFGDSTLMKMTNSNDNMSFLHVFDDADRDTVD